jgi:hypothetical protein
MCIVTGPRIDLAITFIDRIKGLFRQKGLGITFHTKETVIELNGVKIDRSIFFTSFGCNERIT